VRSLLRMSETVGVRDGVVGGLMEMVSFPVEEGWETERFPRSKSHLRWGGFFL
jgi:hypothetical protein